MFKSIVEGFKMLFSKDEDKRTDSYIEVSYPDIEVKVKFTGEKSKQQIKTIIDNAIELSYSERMGG